MTMQYSSPFGDSAHEDKGDENAEASHAPVLEPELEVPATSYVGFKAPMPWDGWMECERRERLGGYLYPSWHPFAVFEGNYEGSDYFDGSHLRAPPKVKGAVDEDIEVHKKQFAIPMRNKMSYTPYTPVTALKRPT